MAEDKNNKGNGKPQDGKASGNNIKKGDESHRLEHTRHYSDQSSVKNDRPGYIPKPKITSEKPSEDKK